jgi:hypothetical protein
MQRHDTVCQAKRVEESGCGMKLKAVVGRLLGMVGCLVLTAGLPLQADGGQAAGFAVVTSDDGVLISEQGHPVAFYQRTIRSKDGRWARNNYLHPVYDLDGQVLTEDFPEDHGHHRGIFWAWHQVWVGEKRMGDAWECHDFEWRVLSVETEVSSQQVTLTARVLWQSAALTDDSGKRVPFVEETTRITFHPRTKVSRAVDFEIALVPLTEGVRIGGSEDRKGYGGFSPRIRLTGNQTFLSRSGPVEPQVEAISAGPWIDISNDAGGVTIFDHPDNPRHPQPWILRGERSMQNAAYPGREPVLLSAESPTVLRYRVAIHQGRLTTEQIDRLGVQKSE